MTNIASIIIVDNVFLNGRTAKQILSYFRKVLNVIKHHFDTIKLKKCKWFQYRCKFVGIDVETGVTQPARSINEAFAKLERPNTWGDLHMLIGLFGFYSQFLTPYELDIRPWRYIFSKQPQPETLYQK